MRNRTQFRRHAVAPEPGIQPTRQARRFITIHHISSQFRIHARRCTGAPRNSAPSLEFKTKPIPIFGHYSRGCRTFTSRSTNSKPTQFPTILVPLYNRRTMHRIFLFALIAAGLAGAQTRGFQSADLLKLRSVGDVQWSPDGSRIAYTDSNNDGPRRPYSQLWIMTVADGKSIRLAVEKESSSGPEWSPDGQWIAYQGGKEGKSGLMVARPDGSGAKFLAELQSTNSPLPTTGKRLAW